MDKRTKERLEREKLKRMIANNPKLKSFLEAATDETGNKNLKEILEPVLADTFEKIMLQGIQTGWMSHALRCKAKIESCKTLQEAIDMMDKEAHDMADKLHINIDEVESDEN